MPVRYNGPNGVEELIPAPLVDISKNYVRDEGGNKLHPEYTFTLTGTIVNVGTELDSPDSLDYDGMEGILAEEARIRNLFSKEGGRLEIESPGGGGPNTIDAYCTVESINFERGVWVNRANYTIVLKSTMIEMDDETQVNISSSSENWSINENDDGSYTINHALNAVGRLVYSASGVNNPLSEAKQWCRERSYVINTTGTLSPSGIDTIDFSTLLNPLSSDTANFWNMAVVENIGNRNYSWQLTESFIHNPSGNTIEEFSASLSFDQENPRKVIIAVNGAIKGLADRSRNLTLRNQNAKTKFDSSVEPNIYSRVITYAPNGFSVNPIPITKQISYEYNQGELRYSYSFHAGSGSLITNAIEENVNISDVGTTDVFAQIPVPGRAYGPVVQYMNTSTLPERTVSISAVLAPDTTNLTVSALVGLYNSKPNTDPIVNALKPNAGYYYIKQDSEEWNPIKRQYGRTVSWVIQPEGASVSGVPHATRNPLTF